MVRKSSLDLAPVLLGIGDGLDEEITLSSLAERAGLSAFHFHRLFTDAVGETPKAHVERLRLERASYKTVVTRDSLIDIGLSVGFQNHETFIRAFRRKFGCTPSDYRQAAWSSFSAQADSTRDFRGEGCLLSEVRFITLPRARLLAVRRLGGYDTLEIPLTETDPIWTRMSAWAGSRGLSHGGVPITICYDSPYMTPPPAQRLDACFVIAGEEPEAEGDIRVIDFPGGRFGVIEHRGPYDTIIQAYRGLVDGIHASGRYRLDEGPPMQVFREIHVGGDPAANLSEVHMPVVPV
jgi:AraC family transcriptional regulator